MGRCRKKEAENMRYGNINSQDLPYKLRLNQFGDMAPDKFIH